MADINRKYIIPALAGTTVMTVFSCLASAADKRNYNEPELLAVMLKEMMKNKRARSAAGWALHYTAGICWAPAIRWMIRKLPMGGPLPAALLAGAASGFAGILIWKAAFTLSSRKPVTHYRRFYLQLLLAHVIYCLSYLMAERPRRPLPGRLKFA